MAGYKLTPTSNAYVSGKNILASEHVQFIEGGATLSGTAQSLEAGTAICRDTTTGKFGVYADVTGALPTGKDEFHILNVDVTLDGVNDVIVGEVIIRGSVYDAKLAANCTTAFKAEAAKGGRIRFVKHI